MSTPTPDTKTPAKPRAVLKVRAYLTSRPYECVAGAELNFERGLILAVADTAGLLAGDLKAQWLGGDALRFLREHAQELKPGRCLDLELYHIKPAAAAYELRARVKSCELAPLAPSWIKHEEKLSQPTT